MTNSLCENLWHFLNENNKIFNLFSVLTNILYSSSILHYTHFSVVFPHKFQGQNGEGCPHLLYYQCNDFTYSAKGTLWLLSAADFINIFWAFRQCLHSFISIHHSAPLGSDLWSYCQTAAWSMPLSVSQLFLCISFHLILDLYNAKIYH